jgi:hypothetical protein
MPRISAFYGIVIYMYWNEKDHPVAQFHAYHAGRRASVSMDGEECTRAARHRQATWMQLPARSWSRPDNAASVYLDAYPGAAEAGMGC